MEPAIRNADEKDRQATLEEVCMYRHKIAFFDAKPYDRTAFSEANETYGFDLTYLETTLSEETALLAHGFPVACLFVHDRVDEPIAHLLEKQGVRLLALRSNGYNQVNLNAVRERMRVVRVPKYSPHAVAEYAVGMLLSLNRKTHLSYWRTKMNNFSLTGLQGFDMHGKTAGVIGAGQIGALVVQLLTAFGMRVLVHDRIENSVLADKTRCTYTDLGTLYSQSDVISLHCPLDEETRYLINKKSLSAMKDGVLLINTSRGGLVHTKDLIEALKHGKVGGAALDVYEEEERFFFNDLSASFIDDDMLARLMTFPNVLVSSHQAFFTKEAMHDIASTTLRNVDLFFRSLPLENEVLA